MKIREAKGVLGRMLANMDELSLAKTRNRMLVAAKIADAMRGCSMNQKQLALKMGKTESEVSEWLSGDRNFTLDTLTEIEHTLNVSLLDTESPRYAYSEKVEKQATIVPMVFFQTMEYASTSMSMSGYSKYKKNGTYEY
jgi:transcriptional regulator with XRE-family HTH domain